MTTPTNLCANPEAVQLALLEGRVPDLYPCLQACFDRFLKNDIARQSTLETAEDIFWYTALGLERKAKKMEVTLTASLCSFFDGMVKMNWLHDRSKKAKQPNMKPLDDNLEFYADPDESALIGIYRREETEAMQQCIAQLGEREQTVVRAYLEGTKDEEIMHEIGYSERTGVSVFRKRTFQKIGKLLEAKGFTVTHFQTELP